MKKLQGGGKDRDVYMENAVCGKEVWRALWNVFFECIEEAMMMDFGWGNKFLYGVQLK